MNDIFFRAQHDIYTTALEAVFPNDDDDIERHLCVDPVHWPGCGLWPLLQHKPAPSRQRCLFGNDRSKVIP